MVFTCENRKGPDSIPLRDNSSRKEVHMRSIIPWNRSASWAVVLLFTLAACSTSYISNTEIEDNELNRSVIAFCERYRKAIEDRNIGLLLSLASKNYFEDGGTPTGNDDYDYAGLEMVLKERFSKVTAVRYEMKYKRVTYKDQEAWVDFTYTAAFQFLTDEGERWANKTEDNRLVLLSENGEWKILRGM